MEAMKEMGAVGMPEVKSNIHCLTIVGQIEGHLVLPPQNKTTKYEHMIPQLVALEQSPEVEGVLILLNTVGGDVEAGLAIAEMIAGISKPTVSVVLGGGHSIGVPIPPMTLPYAKKREIPRLTGQKTLKAVTFFGLTAFCFSRKNIFFHLSINDLRRPAR
ncbi:MAG: hypothetical protein C4542_02260 [Dehalococcoidia bacterium]|nr:MAG: hypothetical protein C4542_02260 [Dehalococcoidia bacterium]